MLYLGLPGVCSVSRGCSCSAEDELTRIPTWSITGPPGVSSASSTPRPSGCAPPAWTAPTATGSSRAAPASESVTARPSGSENIPSKKACFFISAQLSYSVPRTPLAKKHAFLFRSEFRIPLLERKKTGDPPQSRGIAGTQKSMLYLWVKKPYSVRGLLPTRSRATVTRSWMWRISRWSASEEWSPPPKSDMM